MSYKLFKQWLFDSNTKSELSDDVIKTLNPNSVLAMFSRLGEITIYLNEKFNNYYLFRDNNDRSFYRHLKYIVIRNNLNYNDLIFMDIRKPKKSKDVIHLENIFPFLREYEIKFLEKQILEHPDDNSYLKDIIKNKKHKLKKATAKQKKILKD